MFSSIEENQLNCLTVSCSCLRICPKLVNLFVGEEDNEHSRCPVVRIFRFSRRFFFLFPRLLCSEEKISTEEMCARLFEKRANMERRKERKENGSMYRRARYRCVWRGMFLLSPCHSKTSARTKIIRSELSNFLFYLSKSDEHLDEIASEEVESE